MLNQTQKDGFSKTLSSVLKRVTKLSHAVDEMYMRIKLRNILPKKCSHTLIFIIIKMFRTLRNVLAIILQIVKNGKNKSVSESLSYTDWIGN